MVTGAAGADWGWSWPKTPQLNASAAAIIHFGNRMMSILISVRQLEDHVDHGGGINRLTVLLRRLKTNFARRADRRLIQSVS
jgi:hypothetical protein